MRKSLVLIGLPILLGGCGLPPAISVASWALDGVSYLATGKSVTDHAISQVANQDCALLRVVQGREICEDFALDGADGPIFSASALSVSEPPETALAPSDPGFVAPDIVEFAQAFGSAGPVSGELETVEITPAAYSWQPVATPEETVATTIELAALPKLLPVPAEVEAPANVPVAKMRFVSVVGSFQHADNAHALAARLDGLGAEVRSIEKDGRTWHRVITAASLSEVQGAGFEDAWTLKVCDGADGTDGSCASVQAGAVIQVAQAN